MAPREPIAAPPHDVNSVAQDEPPDHGINLVSVLLALVVLAALVVVSLWVLPAWFGGSVIKRS